jgi:hypothetical protein
MGKRSKKSDVPSATEHGEMRNMPPEVEMNAKVRIASAGYGLVHAEFCYSLTTAVKDLQCPIQLDYQGGCYVHHNRNMLMDNALQSDATHLMFIDTDIAFPKDGIRRLLVHDLPIVGGSYHYKKDPVDGVAKTTVKPLMTDVDGNTPADWTMDRTKPFECRALPTGFMLINLDVIKSLEPPDFAGDREGNSEAGPRKWFDFGSYAGFVGEDVYFCDYLRNQGVPIWCDPTIPLGHVGNKVY